MGRELRRGTRESHGAELLAEQSATWSGKGRGGRTGRRQPRGWKGEARRGQFRPTAGAQEAGHGGLFHLDLHMLHFATYLMSLVQSPQMSFHPQSTKALSVAHASVYAPPSHDGCKATGQHCSQNAGSGCCPCGLGRDVSSLSAPDPSPVKRGKNIPYAPGPA